MIRRVADCSCCWAVLQTKGSIESTKLCKTEDKCCRSALQAYAGYRLSFIIQFLWGGGKYGETRGDHQSSPVGRRGMI